MHRKNFGKKLLVASEDEIKVDLRKGKRRQPFGFFICVLYKARYKRMPGMASDPAAWYNGTGFYDFWHGNITFKITNTFVKYGMNNTALNFNSVMRTRL